ncbi:MAG TPA: histone deacetylase [Bryobacteraceae bacterium]|nr:histone deacetylase [Bryobacteraceae bacterium]
MRLFYCDHFEIPLPEGHKFPMGKYRLLRERILADGSWTLEPATPAPVETIGLAHDPDYVEGFVQGTLPASVMRRIGFPWSEGLVKRTLASAGGTLAAMRDAMNIGFGGTLAGGTHHAFRSEGSGFCVFNDVAIAIYSLRAEGRARRSAVVDLDVHQGDGTAHFFEHDPDVLTMSLHGANNFPFRKQRSKIDVELPDKAGDEEYLAALDAVLPRVFESAPEIVFYLSGVDALASDVLGRLSLTHEGLMARDRRVIGSVHRAGLPLVITLGGGYSRPIELSAEAHANTFRVAAEVYVTPSGSAQLPSPTR